MGGTMNRIGKNLNRLALAASAMAFSLPGLAAVDRWKLNMTPGVTEVSRQVYDIHMIILWICILIGVLVFGAMGYAIFKFRKSKGAVAEKWSHNDRAEIVLTVIPVLILVAMAWPATKVLINMADTRNAEMTIEITGYQWKWGYRYVDSGVSFISSLDRQSDDARQLGSGKDPKAVPGYLLNVDRPLVIPADTKVRFVITAADVIHAWWVPALGWKQDAIPGIINDQWTLVKEPGVYRGQCAELCGKDHGFMPIVVEVKPKAEFEQWLAAQQAADGDPAANLAATDTAKPAAAEAAPTQG
jgi:cytochrome c oxidase subunit 2